jgi:hypothetical protein
MEYNPDILDKSIPPNDWIYQRTDRVICHYTNAKTAMENILASGKVLFGKLQNTNDPIEKEPWIPVIHGSSVDVFRNAHVDDIGKTLKEIKQRLNVFCCSMDTLDSNPSLSTFEVSGKSFAVPSLWAHYGENHKGVCLAFNREKLINCIRRSVPHARFYSNEMGGAFPIWGHFF